MVGRVIEQIFNEVRERFFENSLVLSANRCVLHLALSLLFRQKTGPFFKFFALFFRLSLRFGVDFELSSFSLDELHAWVLFEQGQ
ncbi:hypothetical protein KHA94_06990 [Bacillus sp. FJAT-49705]|uniref:Uncharacterized protein n=1 Tax=Cytobacillus citreus TaxID=2833586 RepID=A0ABS5NQ65_9BACI|nr:hypothetical protein [Cytobacillus citreus]MBS4189950.1 hypothetical protein [Cytobacillus citreus]